MGENFSIPTPKASTIGEVFNNMHYSIPVYQRKYSWQRDQINDFLLNLKDVIDGTSNTHFFGQIVTNIRDDQVQEIIDGQQRVTTSSIFMAVLRDHAQIIKEEDREGNLSNDEREMLSDIILQINGLLGGRLRKEPTLVVDPIKDSVIQKWFMKTIHKGDKSYTDVPPLTEKSEVINNFKNAYDIMYTFIQKELLNLKTLPERVNYLYQTRESFIDRFYIVSLSSHDETDAFIIFETLNTRGKDLAPSDIIKTHLISVMGNDRDTQEASKKWNVVFKKLKERTDLMTSYIRVYWSAKHQLVPSRSLYKSIKGVVKNRYDANEFLSNLEKHIELYKLITKSGDLSKADKDYLGSDRLANQVTILNKLGLKLYYPILLSLFQRSMDPEDMTQVMATIVSIYVRLRVIKNEGTNQLESKFSDTAQRVFKGVLKTKDEIIRDLKSTLMKNDNEIKSALSAYSKEAGVRGPKKWSLMYLIYGIYSFDESEGLLDMLISGKYKLVHIHSTNVDSEHTDMLGNWTILEKGINYNEKAERSQCSTMLRESKLKANQALANKLDSDLWTNKSVISRQEELITPALSYWK